MEIKQVIKELEEYFLKSDTGELYKFVLATVEKPLIEDVLNKTKGNQCKAAKILGINRNTLHSKIKKLGITIKRYQENHATF